MTTPNPRDIQSVIGSERCPLGGFMDLDQAIKRQALAEWRDVQIVGAASLVNLAATEAKAAFEDQLIDDALRESLFAPTEWASERIDFLMRAALKPELETFLRIAAEDLLTIDPGLAPIAEALKRDDALTMPISATLTAPAQDEDSAQVLAEASEDIAPQTGLGWLTRIGGRVATGATGLATTATAAVNTVTPERLKQRTRLRAAAGQRIEDRWMGQGAEPHAVLNQVISLIDQAAYSARTSLS